MMAVILVNFLNIDIKFVLPISYIDITTNLKSIGDKLAIHFIFHLSKSQLILYLSMNLWPIFDLGFKNVLRLKSKFGYDRYLRIPYIYNLYTLYPFVACALGLAAAFRPSVRANKGILHTDLQRY